MQTENDESVESFCLQESLWRWSYMQSVCRSCTSRRAPSMPESFHSSPHMWRALVFNTINHRGGLGSWEGGLYSLDWTFDSAFWLVLRLVTMYLDDWIQKRCCCEAGAWLRMRFTPQTISPPPPPLSSSCDNLRAFVQHFPLNYTCQTGVSPTAAERAKCHTWAGSFVLPVSLKYHETDDWEQPSWKETGMATDAFTTSRKAFRRYRNVTASPAKRLRKSAFRFNRNGGPIAVIRLIRKQECGSLIFCCRLWPRAAGGAGVNRASSSVALAHK